MKVPRTLIAALIVAFSTLVVTLPSNAQRAVQLDTLRLNQIQVIGSHNSFKAAIEPELYRILVDNRPELQALDYAHPSLTDQLSLGLRNLELDVFHDPEGGRYAKPLGLSLVQATGKQPQPYDLQGKMQEPGFKVMHVQDIDFRSHVASLADALAELRQWSDKHPRHLPVVITFNCKDKPIDLPNSTQPLPFDRVALDELDQAFFSGLGKDRLILPDDVRGNAETLEAAVLSLGWPRLATARGKFLLVLDETGKKQEDYVAGHPSLRGRAMFVNSEPGSPEAAFMIRNSPRTQTEEITRLVKQGYLVRTRADAGTTEARNNDFTKFDAAKKSGAQVISTDYYLADWRLNPSFRIRFEHQSFHRLNPVTSRGLDLADNHSPLE